MCKCRITNRSGAHQYEGERWQSIEHCPLHAAAPALLEALEAFIVYADEACKKDGRFSTADAPAYVMANKARAAIRAAKGETA